MIKMLQCHVRSLVRKVFASLTAWRMLSVMARVCWTGVARSGAKWKEGHCTVGKRGGKKRGIPDVGNSVFEGRQPIVVG